MGFVFAEHTGPRCPLNPSMGTLRSHHDVTGELDPRAFSILKPPFGGFRGHVD